MKKNLYRLILPKWAIKTYSNKPAVLEGNFTDEQIKKYNSDSYGIYTWPNYPSEYKSGTSINGSIIDVFNWCFIDIDLKDGIFANKTDAYEFIEAIGIPTTKVIDSGGGVHAYWKINNLDAMSYLRFQRRLVRLYHSDEATCSLAQLMRVPNTFNTKLQNDYKMCTEISISDINYSAEELDKLLPAITIEDEEFCQTHYNKTYGINQEIIDDSLPPKFGAFIRDNPEAKELWAGVTDDRSKSDFRLAHLMFANDFTREEAASVLVNSRKAMERAPIHRTSYATNIVDKIWTFELAEDKTTLDLSMSVKEILQKSGDTLKGTPFRCHPMVDNTVHGFRLGQVIGLVAGSGVGKTAYALNMFRWFAQKNPDYHHFFVPLEQPANEIADRWKSMCGTDVGLHDKVHIISNYDEVGNFRHLSFDEIKEYIEKWQKTTGKKVGCVVVDHIGALKKKGKDGENQDIMDICHSMKAFAVQTNTLLIMQSQTSRSKAGIGDIELDKDAAYGTVYFESYCDYLITLWQPLKRCANEEACPTVSAFKFCKIRHKKTKQDIIQEDVLYYMYFDSETERFRPLTEDEKVSFTFFLTKSTNKRKSDRRVEVSEYVSVPQEKQVEEKYIQ